MVYRPTARVLTILELLQSHGRMTGAELARRLEVDIRIVRNYVQTLIDLGIPVEAERGRSGTYFLRAGYKLPPLIFTVDESLALTLSLLVARQPGLAMTVPAFEGVLASAGPISSWALCAVLVQSMLRMLLGCWTWAQIRASLLRSPEAVTVVRQQRPHQESAIVEHLTSLLSEPAAGRSLS